MYKTYRKIVQDGERDIKLILFWLRCKEKILREIFYVNNLIKFFFYYIFILYIYNFYHITKIMIHLCWIWLYHVLEKNWNFQNYSLFKKLFNFYVYLIYISIPCVIIFIYQYKEIIENAIQGREYREKYV